MKKTDDVRELRKESYPIVEVKGIRVLTTKQIAEGYETTEKIVSNNFNNNIDRYVEGKHYICLTGETLREYKRKSLILGIAPNANKFYLWTEKGALLHAKSINTDKAWEVYDYLVDAYFRAKMKEKETVKPDSIPPIDDPISLFRFLLIVADYKGVSVKTKSVKSYVSYLDRNRIAIKNNVTVERAAFELAWCLSHVYIHSDYGDMVDNEKTEECNKVAKRAAEMLVTILDMAMQQGLLRLPS